MHADIIFIAKSQSEMRKSKGTPSRSGLFGPFNVNVILLFYVSMVNFSLGLRFLMTNLCDIKGLSVNVKD